MKIIVGGSKIPFRTITPGDLIIREGTTSFFVVGTWPGSGTRTITNIVTGDNETIGQRELDDSILVVGTITLENIK